MSEWESWVGSYVLCHIRTTLSLFIIIITTITMHDQERKKIRNITHLHLHPCSDTGHPCTMLEYLSDRFQSSILGTQHRAGERVECGEVERGSRK